MTPRKDAEGLRVGVELVPTRYSIMIRLNCTATVCHTGDLGG
jgi:hypothetical protein